MKRRLFQIIPWIITAIALAVAFRGVDVSTLLSHVNEINLQWVLLGLALTCCSYVVRAWRWLFLFPERRIRFYDSARVLILGFFMNNVLPARAGEFVRAHMGARVTGEKRTLVLATIASERLVDGLTISVMFLLFAIGLGDEHISDDLMYVALLFGIAAVGVLFLITFREQVFAIGERIAARIEHKATDYTLDRLQVFVNGLSPLTTLRRLPAIVALSAFAWGVELTVYLCVSRAFGVDLALSYTVLLLVAVNFSSLIPAAPGGIGVIEAVGSGVLRSVGLPAEQALMIVICQHLIQYLVVGIPGAVVMLTWHSTLREIKESRDATEPS